MPLEQTVAPSERWLDGGHVVREQQSPGRTWGAQAVWEIVTTVLDNSEDSEGQTTPVAHATLAALST